MIRYTILVDIVFNSDNDVYENKVLSALVLLAFIKLLPFTRLAGILLKCREIEADY